MGDDSANSNQDAFDAAQVERDRTLVSARRVEDALSHASGGSSWAADLKSSLGSLRDAMTEERQELERPGSLLAMISAERPRRFGPRVRGIREQYDDIVRQVESFQRELEHWDGSVGDVGDVRDRADWIIRTLHNCRRRQADLVFEALELDLGDSHDE
jgi:hypothetical protein